MTKTATAPKAKSLRLTSAAKSRTTKAAAAPTTAEKVAKPKKAATPVHAIGTSWDGASTVMNARVSRTPINFEKFGSLENAPLTDRDRKSLADLRAAFQKKAFARANVDAGILRRMGERGYLEHVSGSDVAADAQFRLTARAFTPEAMQS